MEKILIIDDDQDIVESMKVVLESKGYGVVSASSGKEGLETAKKESAQLVILDVMMEAHDTGFDVARELRKDENYKKVPILMLTAIEETIGWDFKNEAGNSDWLPVSEYMDKPIKADELIRKVEELLGKK